MGIKHGLLRSAVTVFICAGAALVVPATASAEHAGEPCQPGRSNQPPRSCVLTPVDFAPAWTLGNGVCAGLLSAHGQATDGPLYQYSANAGATHSIELRLSTGIGLEPLSAGPVLGCAVTAIVDWHNLDTGGTGSVSQYVDPFACQKFTPGCYQHAGPTIHMGTGPGRVRLTLRTDHPNIPSTIEIIVP
ncbi:hypothetical protein OHA40_17515 [Nocardia sp. NBC_00508]|uniref:hypothetical protein n=1 Tax=Nocardia sp. NBC_00508 TaxID=2975992 RepID=UPI002E822470|nr:hypothetical protein [Nocardia sp. NBC_00508]WUD63583.1 hypothetical protein OHA40_17515 [Nocardia sp. NBC_00508]